jgi:hypothetical protein
MAPQVSQFLVGDSHRNFVLEEKIRSWPARTSRVIRRLYLCVIFGMCNSEGLLQFLCYKSVRTSADRLKRLALSAL